MDKIKQYQTYIKEVIYDLVKPSQQERIQDYQEYEDQIITDDKHGHYLLFSVGWQDMQRIHGCTVHIDLKGTKIWIQQDWTDTIIVDRFLERGVPPEDIVLAFHAPYKRPYLEFAVS